MRTQCWESDLTEGLRGRHRAFTDRRQATGRTEHLYPDNQDCNRVFEQETLSQEEEILIITTVFVQDVQTKRQVWGRGNKQEVHVCDLLPAEHKGLCVACRHDNDSL